MGAILVGLLGVLAGTIIVAICHCIIVFCNDAQTQRFNNSNSNSNSNNNGNRRVEVTIVVESKYSAEAEQKQESCSICLGEFKEAERVRVLPECTHIFHISCIDKWLHHHSTCPLCRAKALPPLANS